MLFIFKISPPLLYTYLSPGFNAEIGDCAPRCEAQLRNGK